MPLFPTSMFRSVANFSRVRRFHRWRIAVTLASLAAAFAGHPAFGQPASLQPAFGQPTSQAAGADVPATGAPPRLRQQVSPADPAEMRLAEPAMGRNAEPRLAPYVLGEFERFVQRQTGLLDLRRFGAEVITAANAGFGDDVSPLVPADYVVAAGDELQVFLWGSVDADLMLVVDRSGRISIPRVGSIVVAGVRSADLTETISRRVAQIFKNYQISVSLGALRGIRVFVSGFAVAPGSYNLNSLSSITVALARAGGPSAAGSFRTIELRRANKAEAVFDLYDFMLRGDRSADRLLQAGDVIHVNPVGTQVAVVGSVNRAAILELKAGETVADVLRMAGGFSAVADRTRLAIERLDDRSTVRVMQLELPQSLANPLGSGDLVRAFSAVDAALPVGPQNKRVRVEGEVQRPGDYVLPAASSVSDAVRAAGGLTPRAYVFGTDFSRETVRTTQEQNYERVLRDMETDFARTTATQRVASVDEATAQTARGGANARLIERLRAIKPTGRVVLQLEPGATELPDLALEDGDRISVPAQPTSVGIFGSVFNGGNYLYASDRKIGDYLQLAGGPTRGADDDSTFVVRANGAVVSGLQYSTWLGLGDTRFAGLPAKPGDTIFVPEKLDKTTFMQNAKDWTQILAQFALGAAALATLGN